MKGKMTMKRFLSMLLALAIVLSVASLLVACDNDKDDKDEDATEEATTTAVTTVAATTGSGLPKGYKLYKNEDISFVYPEAWALLEEDGTVLIQNSETGDNISLTSEPRTDAYDGIDGMKFAETYSPIYEQLGMGITDIFVKEKETNGIAVTEILYKVYMFESTFYMMTTQYIFHVDDLTYTLITTVVSDRQFRNKLFTSLELVQ